MKRALVSKRMGIPAGAHLFSEGITGRPFFPTPLTLTRLNDRGAGARQSCRRWNSNSTTNSDERRHPLANVVTPRGTVGPNPNIGSSSPSPLQVRRWSTLTAILLATLTGATTYIIGFSSGMNLIPDSSSKKYKLLSVEGFEAGLKELGTWLPSDCYATDKDSLVSHGYSDWAALDSKALPGAVLYPRSTEDVVKIVKIAAKHSIPLIPYSGGTSLEGHTFAPPFTTADSKRKATVEKIASGGRLDVDKLQPGLAWTLDFSENMAEIVAIHADDLDIVVQPGVGYEPLNATLAEQGIPLFFPVDPAPGAQIGGMIGTGASGTNAVKHGTMRENVLNLTVVMPDGEVIKTRQRAKKSSVGPDLTKLFVGSEGTLGIITEATLKLAPKLPSSVAVADFPSIQAAADAARDLVQQGVGLACIEILDDVMVKAINKKGGGITWDEKPSLFLKFNGDASQIKNDVERTRKIAKNRSGGKFTFARNDAEAEQIWYSRKMALYSAIDYLEGARCWVTDVCVPISAFPQLVAETKEDLLREGIIGPVVGHAGDGNFHALLLFRNDEELVKVEGLVHRMVKRAQRLDGTATGEHGVGLGKREYLENELGAGSVELLRRLKEMIDPQNIMNPGKLIPDRQVIGKTDI